MLTIKYAHNPMSPIRTDSILITILQELLSWHRPRIARLLEGGVDILACETLPALREAEILCQLLEEFPSALAWMSFSCRVMG